MEDIRQSELTPGQNALQIAMRTMKERCYLLQRRLKTVEDENIQLTIQCSKSKPRSQLSSDIELNMLQANVAQLTKEKSQLVHYVFMVTCENKKLWSNLSMLTKHNNPDELEIEICDEKNKPGSKQSKDNSFTVPHLIRSQTFTHPNPKLRAKIDEGNEKLEEISLKVLGNFLAEKSELLQQYEQMVQIHMAEDRSGDKMAAGEAGADSAINADDDMLEEIKNQTCNVNDMKKLALQQQADLKLCLSKYEKILTDKACQECKAKSGLNKTAIENVPDEKDFQDSSDVELPDSLTRWVTPTNSATYHEEAKTLPASDNRSNSQNQNEKICPICGNSFVNSFGVFVQHVENHFLGDEELDSLGDNFEVVTTTVGNNFN